MIVINKIIIIFLLSLYIIFTIRKNKTNRNKKSVNSLSKKGLYDKITSNIYKDKRKKLKYAR